MEKFKIEVTYTDGSTDSWVARKSYFEDGYLKIQKHGGGYVMIKNLVIGAIETYKGE